MFWCFHYQIFKFCTIPGVMETHQAVCVQSRLDNGRMDGCSEEKKFNATLKKRFPVGGTFIPVAYKPQWISHTPLWPCGHIILLERKEKREKIEEREREGGESWGERGQRNIPFPLTSISPDLVKRETFPLVTTMSAGGGESTKPNYQPFSPELQPVKSKVLWAALVCDDYYFKCPLNRTSDNNKVVKPISQLSIDAPGEPSVVEAAGSAAWLHATETRLTLSQHVKWFVRVCTEY